MTTRAVHSQCEGPGRSETTALERLLMQADGAGYRLEIVRGLGVWEAHPAWRHQSESFRIQSSMRRDPDAATGCPCVHVADVCIRFPDGSLTRPDLAIFCRQPDELETAVTLLPEAVVEILSRGYEAKDIDVGVPFYLQQGVKDILVFDPYTRDVRHVRADGERTGASPLEVRLECGCVCVV